MPSCLIEQDERMRSWRDRERDFVKMQGHSLAVARGQDESGLFSLGGGAAGSYPAPRRHASVRVANAELRRVAADLGTANGVDAFLKQVAEADVLVNNLGIFEAKPFAEILDADWIRLFEVNVLSGVRFARRCFPSRLAAAAEKFRAQGGLPGR